MQKFLNKYLVHGDQKKLAMKAGISETLIWSWRSGRSTPKLTSVKWLIVAMSKYYNIDEATLWLEVYNCV